jgi:hypothetical protein
LRDLVRFLSRVKINPVTECWEWNGSRDAAGYGFFNSKSGSSMAHRWIFEKAHETVLPKEIFVCHTCDNKCCVNLSHLYSGTHIKNMMDAHERGRFRKGEAHSRTTLTKELVLEIRRLSKTMSVTELSKIFNMSTAGVSGVIRRRTWKHI